MRHLQKFILALLAIVIFISGASAQGKKTGKNFSVEWGPDVKLKGTFPTDMLLYDKGSFFVATKVPVLFSFAPEINLAKFNSKLDLVEQSRIKTEEADKKANWNHELDAVDFNGEIYIIEQEKVNKEKKMNFYFESVNKSSLEPSKNKILVYTIDYSVDKDREDDAVTFHFDKDEKFIVILDQHYAEKKEKASATVVALDKSFKKMWNKNITLPVVAVKSGIMSFDKYIDENSNLYLLAKIYKEDSKRAKDVKEGELNYDFHIYMTGENVKTFVDYPFNLKDKAVSQVKLNTNTKGELVAVGIYADINAQKNKVSAPKGIFFTTIDPEKNQIKSQSYKEFGSEIFTAGMKERKAEKAEKKLEKGKDLGFTFLIRDLVTRKDGGSTMFAEEYNETTVTYFSGNRTYSKTMYTYQNIIVAKISAGGEVNWVQVIPKKQVTEGITFPSSFLMYDHQNDTYSIFFNDNRENLTGNSKSPGEIQPMSNFKKTTLVYLDVASDGSLTKRTEVVRLPPDDDKTRFYPKLSFVPEGENDIILFGTERSHEKFARIHFPEQ